MTRLTRLAALGVALLLAAGGCAATGAAGDAPGVHPGVLTLAQAPPLSPLPAPVPRLPAQVTGADGERVRVTDVSRIVPLTGPIAEIVFALGLGERVVARDERATFPEAAHLPVVTKAHAVSPEGVLSLRPTLVLTDTFAGPPEALQAIRAAGVPVVAIPEAWTLKDIWPRIRAVAGALGVPDAGDRLVRRSRERIARVRPGDPRHDRPIVAFLYLRGPAGVYLLGGEGSGADALIEAAGGVDAGASAGLGPFTPLTSEALAGTAPDVLLVMTGGLESVGGMEGLADLPGIAQTPAGRYRRVVAIEDGLLLGFGPRTDAVLEFLGGALARLTAEPAG